MKIKINFPELKKFHNKTYYIKDITGDFYHIEETIEGIGYNIYLRKEQIILL